MKFNEYGLLQPGDHLMTISDLKNSILVRGESWIVEWNKTWRRQLVDNLTILIYQLWDVGIEDIFIDGSFVTIKAKPGDIDGYFIVNNLIELERVHKKLLKVNSYWEWHARFRMIDPHTKKYQLPMWHIYKCEIFPSCKGLYAASESDGLGISFPDYFRIDKEMFSPKGIVKIVKE